MDCLKEAALLPLPDPFRWLTFVCFDGADSYWGVFWIGFLDRFCESKENERIPIIEKV